LILNKVGHFCTLLIAFCLLISNLSQLSPSLVFIGFYPILCITKFKTMKITSIQLYRNFFIIIGLLLLLAVSQANAASRIASVSGNWDNTATWGGAAVPTAADDVTINNGINVSINGTTNSCLSLTTVGINNAATSAILSAGGGVLVVTNAINIATGTGTATGTLYIDCSVSCGSITVGLLTTTINVSSSLSVSGDISPNLDNLNCGLGSFVKYNGNVAQAIFAATYYNITLSGAATKTMSAASSYIDGNLLIEAGATGSTNSLFVNGTTTVNGTLSLTNTTQKTFRGDVAINTGGIWQETVAMPISFESSLLNNGTFSANTGFHIFSGDTKIISGTNVIAIGNCEFASTAYYKNNGILTINTDLIGLGTLENLGILNIGDVGTNLPFDGLIAQSAGNTVNYIGIASSSKPADAQKVLPVTYDNLTLSGFGAKNIADVIINGRLSIQGTATATYTTNAPVYGSLATIEYKGTAIQIMGEELDAANAVFAGEGGIIINNAFGVVMNRPHTITNALTLTLGNLTLGQHSLTVETIVGGNSNSYIRTDQSSLGVLTLKEVTDEPTLLPIGISTYNPLTITNGKDADYTVFLRETAPTGVGVQAMKVVNRQWDISPSPNVSNVGLSFGYNVGEGVVGGSFVPTGMMNGLHFNGTQWVSIGTAMPTGTGSYAVSLTYGGANWSPFSFENLVVVPVELTQFNAHTEGSKTRLNWTTAMELNTRSFDIERSADGMSFNKIGETAAYGKASDYDYVDANPLMGINYYRLKINDLDGKSDHSKIASVSFTGKLGKVKLYPNPVGTEGVLNIELDTDIQNVSITNALGQVILTSKLSQINVSQLTSGMYYVTVQSNNERKVQQFFKQ
jgi:hypothetical protein